MSYYGVRVKPFRIGNIPNVGDMPQNRGTTSCFGPFSAHFFMQSAIFYELIALSLYINLL